MEEDRRNKEKGQRNCISQTKELRVAEIEGSEVKRKGDRRENALRKKLKHQAGE